MERLWHLQNLKASPRVTHPASAPSTEGQRRLSWDPIFMFGAIICVVLRHMEVLCSSKTWMTCARIKSQTDLPEAIMQVRERLCQGRAGEH